MWGIRSLRPGVNCSISNDINLPLPVEGIPIVWKHLVPDLSVCKCFSSISACNAAIQSYVVTFIVTVTCLTICEDFIFQVALPKLLSRFRLDQLLFEHLSVLSPTEVDNVNNELFCQKEVQWLVRSDRRFKTKLMLWHWLIQSAVIQVCVRTTIQYNVAVITNINVVCNRSMLSFVNIIIGDNANELSFDMG